MRTVTRDPNVTPEMKAARRARMRALGDAMRARALAADMAYALRVVGPPLTPEEFELELVRREKQWAAQNAVRAGDG